MTHDSNLSLWHLRREQAKPLLQARRLKYNGRHTGMLSHLPLALLQGLKAYSECRLHTMRTFLSSPGLHTPSTGLRSPILLQHDGHIQLNKDNLALLLPV